MKRGLALLLGIALSTAVGWSQSFDIPAGTPVTIRMIDTVDSDGAKTGDTFKASVEEPVVVNGRTVIPRGADVKTRLVEAKEAGRLSGRSELRLALDQVEIDGNWHPVNSSDAVSKGKSRTKRTGLIVGGAAALGAIIGGIAGGGKGAAIGAASGAGAGTAYQVLTHGEKVKIPSETLLTFTLTEPVSGGRNGFRR